jgi:hypothetical protein
MCALDACEEGGLTGVLFCCHGRLVGKKNARDCRPLANQTRATGKRLGLGGQVGGENEAGELDRIHAASVHRTAKHCTSHSSTHYASYLQPSTPPAHPALLVQRVSVSYFCTALLPPCSV